MEQNCKKTCGKCGGKKKFFQSYLTSLYSMLVISLIGRFGKHKGHDDNILRHRRLKEIKNAAFTNLTDILS